MKKVLSLILASMLILALVGCGEKEPADSGADSGALKAIETAGDNKTLPDSYPKDILPLAVDAEIIDVRENPARKSLEVMYVSDNDIGTLRDFYEAALRNAKNLSTDQTEDGYMISASMDGVDYTIMLSKDAMKSNPQYAGKVSVYLILGGLEGVSAGTQMPAGKGKAWPTADLPGVPQLKGHISQILKEDGLVRLEITVESAEKVKSYIKELEAAGFRFDTAPDLESDHMEFLAFKDSSMMSFAYKGTENAVSIEYQK